MLLMALDMAKKRISELEDLSIESFKTEIQGEKKKNNEIAKYPRSVVIIFKCVTMYSWNTRGRRKREKSRKIFFK